MVERLVCTIHHSIVYFCNIKSRTRLPKELDHGRLTSMIIHAQNTVSAEDCQTARLTRPQTNLQLSLWESERSNTTGPRTQDPDRRLTGDLDGGRRMAGWRVQVSLE